MYRFLDRNRQILYGGKATNLRTRVRSYFSGDRRKKVAQLLRETEHVEVTVCPGPLEADVLEVRLIHEHQPRFNRRSKTWSKYAYLKLTLNERFPRLSVVANPKDDGALYLGPLPSRRFAGRVAEAVESVVPLRRCTKRPPTRPNATRPGPCAAAQLGVSSCPCSGEIGEEAYAAIVQRVVSGLTDRHDLLLEPLRSRMHELALQERFEEAADVRDRAAALSAALSRRHRAEGLRRAGRVVIEVPGKGCAELCHGRLVRSWADDGSLPLGVTEPVDASAAGPLPRDEADEVWCIAGWLEQQAAEVRLVHCDQGLASPFPRVDSFEPAKGITRRRDG